MPRTLPQGITYDPEDTTNKDGTVNYGSARYYQVEDYQTARPRTVTGSIGDILNASEDEEGNFTGFNKTGKFYTPLPTRRGVSDPHEIDRMEDMMRVDLKYFRENDAYADNKEPGLLERLARPCKEFNSFREDLKNRMQSSELDVPAWLKKDCPDIDILRFLEQFRTKKDIRGEVAKGFLSNEQFVEYLMCEEEGKAIHKYLTGLADEKEEKDRMNNKEAASEKKEPDMSENKEPEQPRREPEGPEDDNKARLDRLENQLGELCSMLKAGTIPGPAQSPRPEPSPEAPREPRERASVGIPQPPPDVFEYGQPSEEVFENPRSEEAPDKEEYKGVKETPAPRPQEHSRGSVLKMGSQEINFSPDELDVEQYSPMARSIMISLDETKDAECFGDRPAGCSMVSGAAVLTVNGSDPVYITEISGPVRAGGRVVRSLIAE